MAKIFLIRHGQSLANIERKYQGQTYDTDLTPLGRLQAQALKNHLAKEKIAAVYASPLKRTMQTAQALGKVIIPDPSLIEANHGIWEGQMFTDLEAKHRDLWKLWKSHPSQMVFPAGEAFTTTASRVLNWWQKVSSTPHTIAAITHDNIIQIILTHLHGLSLDKIWDFRIKNASVTLIEPPTIHHIGDISHIMDLC